MKSWSHAVIAAAVAFAISAVVAYAASPTPQRPTRILAYSAKAGDQQAQVSWSPPATGQPIISYTVTASPGGYRSTDPSTTRTVPNLTNGTQYTIKVFATNVVGDGPASTALVIPKAIPPGAPTNLAATQGPGAGQYTLSWTPPVSAVAPPAPATGLDVVRAAYDDLLDRFFRVAQPSDLLQAGWKALQQKQPSAPPLEALPDDRAAAFTALTMCW